MAKHQKKKDADKHQVDKQVEKKRIHKTNFQIEGKTKYKVNYQVKGKDNYQAQKKFKGDMTKKLCKEVRAGGLAATRPVVRRSAIRKHIQKKLRGARIGLR